MGKMVVMLSLDFSKAFDTVRHKSLFDKIHMLGINDTVHDWIRVVHGSLFLDPARPDPAKRWPDPTRPAIADKKSDPTRPDPRPDPSPILTLFNWIIIY